MTTEMKHKGDHKSPPKHRGNPAPEQPTPPSPPSAPSK
ncbi:hypothetical protein ABH930_000818 [Kitasatospora sp. GAS204A]|nr:hypothetical protein [Kitasatospora sp. GAS204B]